MSEPHEYEDYADDDYDDEVQDAISRCGQDGNYCWDAGTEYCSFFCPFNYLIRTTAAKTTTAGDVEL